MFLTTSILLAALPFTLAFPKAELLPISNTLAGRQVTSISSARPADPECTHGPSTRQCWGGGYSVNTNYDAVWPNTGNIVRYTLDIQNTTMAPDGVSRSVYAINGQYPGPTIRAKWGDTLSITVKNSLSTNGTSIHWHGIRQWQTNSMDGTNGITECPLAPGQSRTYTFLCTQFGSTWYHSHFSDQYSDGVVGTIVIDGPATSNYDVDLGPMPISDWFHTPAFTLAPLLQRGLIRGAPNSDNILFNGTNVYSNNGTQTGQYHRNALVKGKKYRLRLINTSTNDNFKVSLDGHNLTVISADFVPIRPWTTDWLLIGIGARYDVIINANQAIDSYWFHAVPQQGCSNSRITNAVSIFDYQGANNTTPSPTTRNRAPPTNNDCSDPNTNLIPYVKLNVPTKGTLPLTSRLDVGFGIVQNALNQTQVQWTLNETAIQARWERPTLQYVLDNTTSTLPKQANIISLPTRNTWSYWIIQAIATLAPPVAHPIHLHGHDFYVLGAGTGIFDGSQPLKYENPPRRDVAMLPPSGWLALAFITDNPGAWLMHCHIAWHVSLGLGAQFLERVEDLKNQGVGEEWRTQCEAWEGYYATAEFRQEDSGL